MTISGRIPSGLDGNKFIADLYSKNVLVAVKHKLVVVPVVNHAYESELQKGDDILIPQTNTVAATPVTIGTEGVIKNPFAEGNESVGIDYYYEAPIVIDYMSRRQSGVDLVGLAVDESAYAIAKQLDTSLCNLFHDLSGSVGYGTDGSAVTDDVLIAAVEEIDEADAPEENRVWIFDPSVKADLLTIDKFVRIDYLAGDTILTGQFRKDIYGAPLLITNNLTAVTDGAGAYGVYMHRDALAIIVQENMTVDRVEQPLKHQLTINTTALWGCDEIRDTFGCEIITRKK